MVSVLFSAAQVRGWTGPEGEKETGRRCAAAAEGEGRLVISRPPAPADGSASSV